MTTEPMFSAIAPRYDFCNHLFSFGLDFFWRKKAALLCCDNPIEAALDMCCGTGDMVFALAKTGKIQHITACDISQPMLALAQHKHNKNRGQLPVSNKTASASNRVTATDQREVDGKSCIPIEWLHGPAENTGLPDASFDLITCAFGLRNVNNVAQTVHQMHRLLKPNGKVCILEFFLPQNKVLRSVYSFYLCRVMPLAARLIAGTSGPWHYLARSIEQWEKINLPELLHTASFHDITICPLTFAAVHITIAAKK